MPRATSACNTDQIVGCYLTKVTRVQKALDAEASKICQAQPPPLPLLPPPPAAAASAASRPTSDEGLTLVHFLAQLESLLSVKTPPKHPLDTTGSPSEVPRKNPLNTPYPAESAHVEPKTGRALAPASDAASAVKSSAFFRRISRIFQMLRGSTVSRPSCSGAS
jgi:hypothetical protein